MKTQTRKQLALLNKQAPPPFAAIRAELKDDINTWAESYAEQDGIVRNEVALRKIRTLQFILRAIGNLPSASSAKSAVKPVATAAIGFGKTL